MTAPPPAETSAVVVVGSLNRDYVCRVNRIPAPGQTLLGGDLLVGSGGKGGNQAVAAARAGARTAMVGCVGGDEDGRALLADLAGAGVETSAVRVLGDVRTGAAIVLVDDDGENAIVVAPGANAHLDPQGAVSAVRERLAPRGVLVTQAEIPPETAAAALAAAADQGCRAVLNLAPFRRVEDDLLARCDPLVVNEAEAGELLGGLVRGGAAAAEAARELARRTRSVVVTAGAAGALVGSGDRLDRVPAPSVRVVDTTGAGDAFTGVLAAALSRGDSLVEAARLGVRAGAWSVGRPGAQASYPTRADLAAVGVDPAAAIS